MSTATASPPRRIAVFCGSRLGGRPIYREAARQVGRLLVERDLELVYGGGAVGLMGELADGVLEAGGRVIGVIPRALQEREVAHLHLTRLHVVESMHDRKALMAELSHGFLALPGGFGTLDELLEITTWSQLGFHAKPIALLDVEGYFAGLLELVDHLVREGFVSPLHRDRLRVGRDPASAIDLVAPPT